MAVALGMFSGCGGGDEGNGNKLTYWSQFYTHYSKVGTNMGDAPFFKELMKRTGVEI